MQTSLVWPALAEAISDALGASFQISGMTPVSGGSINSACRLEGSARGDRLTFFVKFNHSSMVGMFAVEARSLNELRQSQTIRVPAPVCYGAAAGQSWLVTEFIQFARKAADSESHLGRQLAALHSHCHARFGWQQNNFIGATPQVNTWTENWIDFFRRHRLAAQLEIAANHGMRGNLHNKGERLMADLDAFFSAYAPKASLLHGDLWGGNCAFDALGAPVIFDPAIYYGDREADLAMTELFGGFGADFYRAYETAWPLDAGYSVRKTLYNLYHILNHANLFGGGYAAQAEDMMDLLLSEL
jgi:fructosamine-3-kinase